MVAVELTPVVSGQTGLKSLELAVTPARTAKTTVFNRLVLAGRIAAAAVTVGIALLAAAVLGPPVAFGWHPFIVYTGSMEPAISRGAIVMVQPIRFENLAAGDVITFSQPRNPGLPITHRVVKVEKALDSGAWQVTTKGDANPSADIWTVDQNQTVGRVVYSIPSAGFLLVALSMPLARQLALAAVFVLIAVRLLATYFKNKTHS